MIVKNLPKDAKRISSDWWRTDRFLYKAFLSFYYRYSRCQIREEVKL